MFSHANFHRVHHFLQFEFPFLFWSSGKTECFCSVCCVEQITSLDGSFHTVETSGFTTMAQDFDPRSNQAPYLVVE